ncbi:MAG: ATP-binding protein [Kiritimatiellae bacterium]|nr:ATP-binding protein [Kiritimatiellia bacterium]
MKRNILLKMTEWNHRKVRKPLVLMGARQVGKTWLLNEFARTVYGENAVYVNLMKMKTLRNQLESGDITPKSVLERIGIALDVEIVPGKSLLLLDEIQESSNALTSLKFFNEDMPELAVVAAGSLLGLAVGRSAERRSEANADNPNEPRGSFPVGKVNLLEVCPMDFPEFVRAIGKSRLADILEGGDPSASVPYAAELADILKRYLLVGGMPEAVNTYVDTNSLHAVRDVQAEILSAYDSDFVKHAPIAMLPKIRLLWNSIPAQLAKENKKFVYAALKTGARAREYEAALQWLDDAGMIRRVYRASTPRLPLKSYRDFSAFRLYAHDVGLLGAMSDLPPSVVLEGNAAFTNFKGTLAEQYVLQELTVNGFEPCYWMNDAGSAEVEFVIQGERGVFPVEVKAGINTQAKSLKVYRELFSPPFSFRTSLAAAHDGAEIKDIPLYAFGPAARRMVCE